MKRTTTTLLLLLALAGQAATVTGNLKNDVGLDALKARITFSPDRPYVSDGTNTYIGREVTTTTTNGDFTVSLVGGFYSVDFGPWLKPIRLLVPWDSNVYNINQCAVLAVNAAMQATNTLNISLNVSNPGVAAGDDNLVVVTNLGYVTISAPTLATLQAATNLVTAATAGMVTNGQPWVFLQSATNFSTFTLKSAGNAVNVEGVGGKLFVTVASTGKAAPIYAGSITAVDDDGYTNGAVRGVHIGDGSGLTNVTAGALAAGTDGGGLKKLPSYISPMDYGAVGNGIANDTAAVSNAIVALNAMTNGGTLDFLGKVYLLTAPSPAFLVPNLTIQNASILFNSTNGACFTRAITNAAGFPLEGVRLNTRFMNLRILQTAGKPNTNSVGIQMGDYSGNYGGNVTVSHCYIEGFQYGIVNAGITESIIENNKICAWGDCIYAPYVAGGITAIDMSVVRNNDLDQRSCTLDTSLSRMQNVTAVRISSVQCLNYLQMNNNIGGVKQVFVATNGVKAQFSGDQCEGLYSTDTNLCKFELWNSIVSFQHERMTFPTDSNYVADIGLYATGAGQRIDLKQCVFENLITPSFDIFTTNSNDIADGIFPVCYGPLDVYVRSNQLSDARIHYNFPNQPGTHFLRLRGTNVVLDAAMLNLVFQTFGGVWGTIYSSGNRAVIGGDTDFSGGVNFFNSYNAFEAIRDQGGGAAQFVINAENKGTLRLQASGVTCADFTSTRMYSSNIVLNPQATPGSPVEGQVYYNSSDKHMYFWNATAWKQMDN